MSSESSLPQPVPHAAHLPRGPLRAKIGYLLMTLIVIVLDQASKKWIESHLEAFEKMEIIPGFLNLIHVRNSGVAFGLFPSNGDAAGTLVLIGLGLLALCAVAYYFWWSPANDRFLLAALGLVMGGAVGNLIDRISKGAVTDFIDCYVGSYHWHTFNVADSAITVGIALMLIGTFFAPTDPLSEDSLSEDSVSAAEPATAKNDGETSNETTIP